MDLSVEYTSQKRQSSNNDNNDQKKSSRQQYSDFLNECLIAFFSQFCSNLTAYPWNSLPNKTQPFYYVQRFDLCPIARY